jgi:hypothetical protein
MLFPVGGFFRFGDGTDEPHEPVAISFGGNGRNLRFCICQAFEEVLHALDK